MSKFNQCLYRLNPKVLSRIGDDLRQGGSLAGAGVTGIIVFSDNVSTLEGITIIAVGLFIWIMGHYAIYISEKIDQN